MIPIVIFWKEYKAQKSGSVVKFVPCEKCSTEYVFVMERQAIGAGNSMYLMNQEEAAAKAISSADESLSSMLENDFDPVPCPKCGHYQKYMFPKLIGSKGMWTHFAIFGVLISGCLTAVTAAYWSIMYLQNPNGRAHDNMIVSWLLLPFICIIGFGLNAWIQYIICHYDPNSESLQDRVLIGRNRGITREEFEKRRLEFDISEHDECRVENSNDTESGATCIQRTVIG